MRDKRDEPFPSKKKIPREKNINKTLNKTNGGKTRKLNMNKQKSMRIPDHICQSCL